MARDAFFRLIVLFFFFLELPPSFLPPFTQLTSFKRKQTLLDDTIDCVSFFFFLNYLFFPFNSTFTQFHSSLQLHQFPVSQWFCVSAPIDAIRPNPRNQVSVHLASSGA
ncbi:hypothetical protein OUZ56_008398 [Daphnia magna]|uniref:Secreted protein n=1 Tax=Daphnia magna TaxID=35525 RepID=A0ABR0ACV2_9CRUS|nr:hypothetical protein OUZ56_008398 [Daphnia magna]